MLFSSHAFLFIFLPLVLLSFHLARSFLSGKAALLVVITASLFFYGYWNPPFLFLLVGSMLVNFGFVKILSANPGRLWLAIAITLNLIVLGYFKYRNFFLENLTMASEVFAISGTLDPLVVPLAISFFTFQQIALLIDVKEGHAKISSPLDFAAFIALFPQLIAGPIVLFREMREQFSDLRSGHYKGLEFVGPGLIVFAVGLFKKVVLADSIAPYADLAFSIADQLTTLEAWFGAVAYSLQLYFDFSGYSDMAVGLGLMLGLTLPINFKTPFRATSMIDFWKRWHITMTRFFMLYVYSPIALNLARWSQQRKLSQAITFLIAIAIPTIFTFLLSGLWHGAAWHFVAFGAINGIGLLLNHAWREAKLPKIPNLLGWLLTILVVIVSFVYFRAEDMAAAATILKIMFWSPVLVLPSWLSTIADNFGLPWQSLSFLASGSYTLRLTLWITLAGIISLSSFNLVERSGTLRASWANAILAAIALILSIGLLDRPKAFIYFQF